MSTVRFNLRLKREESTLIIAKFRYDGRKIFVYSTRQKIEPKFWNDTKMRPKKDRRFPQYEELNFYLNKIEDHILNAYRKFKNEGISPTGKQLKHEMDILTKKIEPEEDSKAKKITFFKYFESFIEERSKTYKEQTVKSYKVVFNRLKEYAAKNRKPNFEDITLDFYNNYLTFLYSKPYSFSKNTVNKHIRVIKTVLNEATEKGINTNLTFRSKSFKKPIHDTDHIYLNEDELTHLYNIDFSSLPKIERVRDLFIVACYTGLRFSDFTNIKQENIKVIDGVEVIQITTIKTDESVTIPLHPFVKAIFAKYKDVNENSLPKTYSNQKMNEYLKEMANWADFNEKVLFSISKGGKRCDIIKHKWELVTTHTARRSFATNAFKAGVPAISLKQITGHKTESAFLTYIKVTDEENAVLMASHSFFNTLD